MGRGHHGDTEVTEKSLEISFGPVAPFSRRARSSAPDDLSIGVVPRPGSRQRFHRYACHAHAVRIYKKAAPFKPALSPFSEPGCTHLIAQNRKSTYNFS
jgi:hypothetical protein